MSIALRTFLHPLQPFLHEPSVSELCINEPGFLWVEAAGQFHCEPMPALTTGYVLQLAELIAEYNHKTIVPNKPLLSASLPQGERCQFVLPPACESGQIIASIRKNAVRDLSLEDWEHQGAFSGLKQNKNDPKKSLEPLRALYEAEQWRVLLQHLIRSKHNVLICGGTSTAKTTFLNSCLKEIPAHERLITIEGVREVKTIQPNCVHLLANEDQQTGITLLDLLIASLRLRPDRIFVSELRDVEAYPFLRACISGHRGSISTLHADSLATAVEQLCFMLASAHALKTANEQRLKTLIHQAVDVLILMTRNDRGERVINDLYIKGINDHVVF